MSLNIADTNIKLNNATVENIHNRLNVEGSVDPIFLADLWKDYCPDLYEFLIKEIDYRTNEGAANYPVEDKNRVMDFEGRLVATDLFCNTVCGISDANQEDMADMYENITISHELLANEVELAAGAVTFTEDEMRDLIEKIRNECPDVAIFKSGNNYFVGQTAYGVNVNVDLAAALIHLHSEVPRTIMTADDLSNMIRNGAEKTPSIETVYQNFIADNYLNDGVKGRLVDAYNNNEATNFPAP